MQNEVYITISNCNNQPNVREKAADLLCNRFLRQYNFNRLPFYCEFMLCIVFIVHIFLPFILQNYSHGMFSLLPLPRLLSSYKMHVSKFTMQVDQVKSATERGIVNPRSLCSAVFS